MKRSSREVRACLIRCDSSVLFLHQWDENHIDDAVFLVVGIAQMILLGLIVKNNEKEAPCKRCRVGRYLRPKGHVGRRGRSCDAGMRSTLINRV